MIRLVIALMLSALIALGQSTQETAPPSAAPAPSAQSKNPKPEQNPPGQGSSPSNVFKICGPGKPSPCGTAPQALKTPDPDYPIEARKRKVQGTTELWLVVGADGVPRDIKVVRSLCCGLNDEAIRAVKKWRFKPGTLDGHPVAVQINVKVSFHLY